MKLIKSIVRQCSRTALFARVSREAADVLTLLGESLEQDGVTDEAVKTVERELLTHSTEEFCRKFPAEVYYRLKQGEIVFSEAPSRMGSGSGNGRLVWHRLSLYEDGTGEIWDSLFKTGTYETADRTRTARRLFRDEEGIRKIRAVKEALTEIFLLPEDRKCTARGQKLLALAERISEMRYEIRSLLPYLAEEAQQTNVSVGNGESFGAFLARKAESGQLEVRYRRREAENWNQFLNKEAKAKLARWLNEVIRVEQEGEAAPDASASREREACILVESQEWKELLLAVFGAGGDRNSDEDSGFYLKMSDRAAAAFYRVVRNMAELRLSVEAYFAQGRNTADTMELLVLNISPEELNAPENRRKFSVYLNTVNEKNDYRSTIWAGILPGVLMRREGEKNVRQRFAGTGREETSAVGPETVKNLLELAEKYRIMLFYQYETKEAASARAFAESGTGRFLESGEPYEKCAGSRYISCCYPNLTVTEGELYLGAAFIAAGMQAAMQSSEFLKLFYSNIVDACPGIRLDLEKTTAYRRLTAAAPKEVYPYGGAVKDELRRLKYGSLLAAEETAPGWGGLSEMQLLWARTLCFAQGEYIPVWMVMAESFLTRLLRALTHDFKEDELKYQFSNAPGSFLVRLREWEEYANAPLLRGDRIEYRMENDRSVRIIIHWNTGGM